MCKTYQNWCVAYGSNHAFRTQCIVMDNSYDGIGLDIFGCSFGSFGKGDLSLVFLSL